MAQGGKIDLRSLLQLARRRKWFLIIPPIVALIGAYYRISTMEPTYRSNTTILIGQGRDMLRDMSNLMPNSDAAKGNRLRDIAEDIQKQLLSSQILGQVVQRIQLKPSQGMLDQVAATVREHPEADQAALLREVQAEWLAARLATGIVFPKRGNFVEISFDHKDPEVAYHVVKTLADVFIEYSLNNENRGVEGSRKFSEEKLLVARKEYEAATGKLEGYRVALARQESRGRLVSATNVEAANARLNSLNVDISRQQQVVQNLAAASGAPRPRTNVAEYGRGAALHSQMMEKAGRLAGLTVRLSWKDPDVLKVKQDIAALREQYRNEVAKAVAVMGSGNLAGAEAEQRIALELAHLDLELLNRERSELEGHIADYQRSFTRRPAEELELAQLEKEVAEKRAVLSTVEDQVRRLTLKDELRQTDAETWYRIIDPANRPVTPITDDQNKILLIALFGGLGFGVGAVYLLEFFDHSFKSVDEVETFLGLAVLGTIPRIQSAEVVKARNPVAISLLAISIVAALVVAFVLIRQSL